MTSKNHHFLSQCYLRGFTAGESKKSKLIVFDRVEKKIFETKPRNVGSERDFNRIDADGADPEILEKALGNIEAAAAKGLRLINDGQPFEGEVRKNVLMLAALMHVRSPARREHWRKFTATIVEHMMDLTLATKERWDSQTAQLKAKGIELPDDISYEETKKFVDSRRYHIDVPRAMHIEMEMHGLDAVMPYLMERKWVLLEATKESGPFITCDHPLNLMWKYPDKIPPFYRNHPGHGLKDTQVWFPVTKQLAIVGEFDGPEDRHPASPELVANINSLALMYARRNVFTPHLGFTFIFQDESIRNGHFLRRIFGREQEA